MNHDLTQKAGMSPRRWQHIEAIFGRAVELEDAERGPYLDQACAGDTALRQEIDRLLGHDTEGSEFLHDMVGDAADRVARATDLFVSGS